MAGNDRPAADRNAGPRRLPLPRCGFGPEAVAFCLLLGAAGSSCSFDYGSPMDEELDEQVPNYVLFEYRHTVAERDAPVMKLTAEKAEIYEKTKRTRADSLTYIEYDRDTGEIVAEGRADSAVYHVDSGNAELSGSLVFSAPGDDLTLETESLEWKKEARRLEGRRDQLTTIRRSDGTVIRGSGFAVDAATKTVSFREHAEGTVIVNESDDGETSAGTPPPEAAAATSVAPPPDAAEQPDADAQAGPPEPASPDASGVNPSGEPDGETAPGVSGAAADPVLPESPESIRHRNRADFEPIYGVGQ
ncbi:MAG: LPS export ABC transporter periplasmic protein LptC [Spirochaetes bacterium]|nr:LPS export ABC transporter periplasmic protein LptC [Spirochaetota bacterium]